jgi:hypothetical protein
LATFILWLFYGKVGYFLQRKLSIKSKKQNGFGYISGDCFTKISGHAGQEALHKVASVDRGQAADFFSTVKCGKCS